MNDMFFDEMEMLIGADPEAVVEYPADAFTEVLDEFMSTTSSESPVSDGKDVSDAKNVSHAKDVEFKNNKRKVNNRESAQLSRNRKKGQQQKQEAILEENASRIKELEIKVKEQAARIRELEKREASLGCGAVFEKEEI
jgi:uncharacterized protein YaiL (DUF2058 family)